MYTNTGCKRLVDYYFVVSCSDHGKEQTKRRLCRQSLAPPHEKEARHALFALKPKIVDRYPSRNYSDTPLLPWVARASMPRGVRARTIPPAPRYFTFTGWNIDGSKLYGACLEVFEKMDIKKQRQPVYIPKTLGFISHYPYFYAFDVFLRCLWHVIPKKLIRLEDLLMHYFYDIPAPLPRKKIAYDLGKMKVLLACRNEFDVPIMELPIETPFTQLSKDRICMIIKLLLLEHRIVFVCTLVHELTPVCELFASLLFPLRWRHLFIPLVCRPMAEALKKMADYECPFLVGLPRFVYVRPEISSSMPNNTYIVFLDRNEITDEKKQSIPSSSIPNLPSPLEENLRDSIHALARVLTMPDGTVSRDVILQAFRTMFAVITKLLYIANNYNPDDNENENNKDSFVALFKQTNLFKSFKKYYNRINPSDPSLKSIYPFFKQNEALGKHFARRSHSNSWSAGFDQSQYSRDAFRVNQDVIKRVEKQFAKKRADLAASNRNTKFSLPPEFEHLPKVKEFLQHYVFYGTQNKMITNNNNNINNHNNNNNNNPNTQGNKNKNHHQHLHDKNNKNGNIKNSSAQNKNNTNHNAQSKTNHGSTNHHKSKTKLSKMDKENRNKTKNKSLNGHNNSGNDKHIKNGKTTKNGKHHGKGNKKLSAKSKKDLHGKQKLHKKKSIAKEGKHANMKSNGNKTKGLSKKHNKTTKGIVNDRHKASNSQNNVKSSTESSKSNGKNIRNGKMERAEQIENGDESDKKKTEITVTPSKQIKEDHDKTQSNNAAEEDEDEEEEDDSTEESSDDTDSDTDSDSDEDSDDSDDSDDETDTDDDSDEEDEDNDNSSSDSTDDDDDSWGSLYDEPPEPESSAAAVRHNRRFQNLNEFELTPKEKQWFVNCQKQHNLLIANIPEIKPIIGVDLFDDNIIKSWKSFQKQKMHKTYKKPKGS